MQNDQSKNGQPVNVGSGWFSSYFGIGTAILLAHALTAQWASVNDVWKIVAWCLLGAHVISYAGMCLWLWMLLGSVLPYTASVGKPNSKVTTNAQTQPRDHDAK